jgi:hypothetical protein
VLAVTDGTGSPIPESLDSAVDIHTA